MSTVHMYGIDISKHNGNIDLSKYKDYFVIIRAGYYNTKDPKFDRNVRECIKYNIPFGVYLYSYALTSNEALMEAKNVIEWIKPYRDHISMGVWFDMEDADGYKRRNAFNFTHSRIASMCYTFCEYVEKQGYYTGIYCSKSWLGYINPTCKRFDKWVASWGVDDGYRHTDTSAYGTLQQYTSKPLDKNVAYVDISRFDLRKKKPKPQPKPQPKKSIDTIAREVIDGKYGNGKKRVDNLEALGYNYSEVQNRVNQLIRSVNKVYYTVKKGDNLTTIARKYNTTVDKIAQMNGIKNKNLIYTGDVLRVL